MHDAGADATSQPHLPLPHAPHAPRPHAPAPHESLPYVPLPRPATAPRARPLSRDAGLIALIPVAVFGGLLLEYDLRSAESVSGPIIFPVSPISSDPTVS